MTKQTRKIGIFSAAAQPAVETIELVESMALAMIMSTFTTWITTSLTLSSQGSRPSLIRVCR
jgi:hypothetical protein